MKKIYLSPSNQPANAYVVGNTNEKAQMEAVAARVQTLLLEYDVGVKMATLSMGIGKNERTTEAKNNGCDFYFALHSNATGAKPPCSATGAVAFYHPNGTKAKDLATALVKELNAVCPIASNRASQVESGMTQFNGAGYGEIRSPMELGIPSVLLEINFHDNTAAANWIINNKDVIAGAIVKAIADVFGILKKSATPTQPFTGTKIMGSAVATVEKMAAYLISKNPDSKSYAAEYAKHFIDEGKAEGVRGDVAFVQSCLETGNFKFGGDVKAEQNNFAGIGATGGGVSGNIFPTPQIGIRAQIQHLKAYASTEKLNQVCVDPRFQYVTRQCAEFVEWLGQKENPKGFGWAVGADYGAKILTILNTIINMTVSTSEPPAKPSAKVKEGDIVQFTSGAVYKSSNADNPEHSRGKSRCRLTKIYDGKHPYHLISEDDGGVFGWADVIDVEAIESKPSTPALKSLDEITKEVINGKWGNGQERKDRLTAAGYDANAVQAKVNALMK